MGPLGFGSVGRRKVLFGPIRGCRPLCAMSHLPVAQFKMILILLWCVLTQACNDEVLKVENFGVMLYDCH